MIDGAASSSAVFAGRTEEVERLLGVLKGAAAGRFVMVLVRGEPGVGKTSLVGTVADLVSDQMHIVSGACLPLTSLSVPFLPLISAVRGWSRARGATAPDIWAQHGNTGEVVEAFDAWLDDRCSERGTVLTVDDLHWADQSTLDVLTYVLAGPADRRLAVVLTVRDAELQSGHHLHRWLADAVRMPGFIVFSLDSLDRLGTAEQIAGLLGGPARESLVDDVFAHARGNAYLTRLLVEHLSPDAASLPLALPATLRDAVLGSWHTMSKPARELTQLLAVGGPHLRSDQIESVAATVFAGLDDVREAVRLTASAPQSWQHALALAELAHAELWHEEPGGPAHAEAAVIAARASGDPKSLSYALAAQSMAMTVGGRAGGDIPGEEAVSAAVEAGDYWAFCHGSLWSANALDTSTSRAFSDYVRIRREQLVSLGASHTYVGWLCAVNAASLLSLGDWQGCVADLRVVLGASPGPMGEVTARLTAALLAALQGRPDEARVHLRRAEEMYADTSGFLAFEFDSVRAEVALAAGEPERALMAALTGARVTGLPPTRCERLIPLAFRALADLAVRCRDERRSDSEPLLELAALRREFPEVIAETGILPPAYLRQLVAMQALYDAEVLRALDEPGKANAWVAAVDACARAELAWDEAYTLWRAAEAVVPDRARRAEGSALLRRAYRLAAELEATPLLHQLEGLARSARITIDRPTRKEPAPRHDVGASPTPISTPSAGPPKIPGLTPREQEVLALVAFGRTYAEIARALFISEKTVSVHISNLLRKTGTANRIELARLAQRRKAT